MWCITWLAMWYNQCIVIKTSLNLTHIAERLTTGPSDVIAPVGVTLLRVYSHQRNVIASFATPRPNFGSWISLLNLRWFELKMPQNALHLVSCDKQKTALVCFFSGNITLVVFLAWENHSTCGLVGFPARSSGFPRPRKPRMWYFHSKNTWVWFSYWNLVSCSSASDCIWIETYTWI
jgi:hypothetical protein